MSLRFVLGRENVPYVAEVVNRSLKADCTDFTLPSNSSMQYFPDNKRSKFVTKLSRTLQLDGEWEVGLAEIVYPHTWYNIRKGKNSGEI